MNHRATLLPTFALLAAVACGPASEITDEPVTSVGQELTAAPAVMQLSAGDGWRRLSTTGSALDTKTTMVKTLNNKLVVLEKESAIDVAPLPAHLKTRLRTVTRLPGPTNGKGLDIATILDEGTIGDIPTYPVEGGGGSSSSCSDSDETESETLSFDRPFAWTKGDEAGSWKGHIDVDGKVKANASAVLRYRVLRAQTYIFGCVAYGVSFRRVDVNGTARLEANAAVDGKFEKKWTFETTITKPEIVDRWFWVGPVPVNFIVRIPIEAGVTAKATATVDLDAKVIGDASFALACGTSTCTGSRTASLSFAQNKAPAISVAARVDVTPWVKASIRGVLYSESIAYADVGIKGSLPNDLWGYVGNGCGDADNDGVNEMVSGLTLDTRVRADIVAKVSALGSTVGDWSWNVADKHLGFWSFGEGTALDPIFYVESVSVGTATVRGRMRPCWPYTDKVTYRVAWGDGTSTTLAESPSTLFTKTHTYSGPLGAHTVTLDADRDAVGRTLAGRTVDVVPAIATGFGL